MELTMNSVRLRERALIGAALAALAVLAWAYLLMLGMPGDSDMVMPASGNQGLALLMLNAIMWSVMMVAMMLPSAGPMILIYAKIHQQRTATGNATAPTWLFTAGYLSVWIGFAILAALAQWALYQSALLSSAMGSASPLLGGALLITAGAFQFSSLKHACLSQCRSPLSFLMTEWREGSAGVLIMGVKHGAYCAGCCWALMLLMFVGGVMNLAWMAALAVYFMAEKLLPRAAEFTRATGALLICAGAAVLTLAVVPL